MTSSSGKKYADIGTHYTTTTRVSKSQEILQIFGVGSPSGMTFGPVTCDIALNTSNSSSNTRKRKVEKTESSGAVDSNNPADNSSGGDGGSSTSSLPLVQAKVSRTEETGPRTTISNTGVNQSSPIEGCSCRHGLGDMHQPPGPHRYIVHISDSPIILRSGTRSLTDLLAAHGKGVRHGSQDPKRRSEQFRFDCELGDMWTDGGVVNGRVGGDKNGHHRKPYSGKTSSETEKKLDSLEAKGFHVADRLHQGKYGQIFSAHSPSLQRNVALKLADTQDEGEKCPADAKAPDRQGSIVGQRVSLLEKLNKDTNKAKGLFPPPNEVNILQRIKHENIVELYEYYSIGEWQTCLVLELCELGNLETLLTCSPGYIFTEFTSRKYFRDMLAAVTYLHSQDIVHGNIRCSHFLVNSSDRIKLADFRRAEHCTPDRKTSTHSSAKGVCTCPRPYTEGYWLPEVLLHQPYSPRAADVWALGVTLHVILTSRLPFGASEPLALRGMQKGLNFETSKSIYLTKDVVELLKGILHYVIEVRYSLNRIRNSPWVKGPSEQTVQKPYIGNFYLRNCPGKHQDSEKERVLKEFFQI